eukprot:4637103-Karenia_brevis.AAC.1
MPWQEQWAHSSQHGARPGHSTTDVFWTLALQLEQALLTGTPLYGLGLDYSKCFDRLPHGILLALAEHMGLPQGVARPLEHMLRCSRKRFRFGGSVGA